MELTVVYQDTIKISGKNGYVLFNPQTPDDAKIVILDDNNPVDFNSEALCIYGPGEFEAGGIVVKGVRHEGSTMYEIDNGEGKVMHVLSDSVAKLPDEDDLAAVIIKAVGPIDEASLTSISSGITVVYGDIANIPEKIQENKVIKVNMRKKDDLPSNLVYLVKK